MSATREATAANVKPLPGSKRRRYVCGATVAAGEVVSLSSDGYIDPSDTTSAADEAIGVAIQGGLTTNTIDVVVLGPVICMTAATIGNTIFNSATAGEFGESASANNTAIGYAESATVLFVLPEHLA